MTISVIQKSDCMQNLREDWAELSEKRRSPLFDFEWHYSCAMTLNFSDKLHVVVQQDENEAVTAIAPLVILDKDRGTWLEFLGSSHLYEPAGILFQDTHALKSLYRQIAHSAYPVLLGRVPREHLELSKVSPPTLQAGLWLQSKSDGTPVLDLKGSWLDFFESMSSRRRYDHRRALKNADSIGEMRFESHRPTTELAPQLLDVAFEIEDKSWKGRNGSSLRRNEKLASFFRTYATHTSSMGTFRIFFLSIADVPVAMAMCVERYNALWFLKIGYDEDYRQCSPGKLLLMDIIKHCYEKKISRVEHLGTFEPWLSPWTSYIRPHMAHIHYPSNITGARLLCGDVFRFISNRISREDHSNRTVSH